MTDYELGEKRVEWVFAHMPVMQRIRADFALGAEYRPRSDRAPLPMPLLVWGSRDDELVDYASLAGWEARTTAGAPCVETSGGHYYLASESGSMAAAKAAGKVRMEGKDYVMVDGDVVEFRFNV